MRTTRCYRPFLCLRGFNYGKDANFCVVLALYTSYGTGEGIKREIMSQGGPTSWRQALNNELQRPGVNKAVEYRCTADGPLHQQLWTAIAYIDGEEYGIGERLLSKDGAKEQAAKSAYLRYMKPH